MYAAKKIRLVIALVLSFFLSGFLVAHVKYSDRPTIEMAEIREQAVKTASQAGTLLASWGSSIARLATIRPMAEPEIITVSPSPGSGNSSVGFDTVPTSTPAPVSPTAAVAPTQEPAAEPTEAPLPTAKPTSKPKPTNTPAPTQVPTPALPAGYARPGSTREEILQIAAQKACIPVALLKAFLAQESPGDLNYSDRWALFYNGYDWWHRVAEKKEVCSGYGYYTETGLIPPDSLFAGEQCKEGARPGDDVSHSMGAGQMLEYYWNKTYKAKTAQALGITNPDRRVMLDGLTGFGINIKEGTKAPGGCENWDFKYIIKAACVNTGGGSAYTYYYGIICRNYNKYANQNNNCDNVASMIVPDSYCQLK